MIQQAAASIEWNFLMSSNFYFTWRQAVCVPILALLCPVSTRSDPVWITATDSPHVIAASGARLGFWFISCPYWISPSWRGGCGVVTAGRTSHFCQDPDASYRCLDWHRVPSPSLAWTHLLAIWYSRASASHTSHPPARQPSTETFGTGFAAPAATSSPPYRQQWGILCPRLSLWDTDASCSE